MGDVPEPASTDRIAKRYPRRARRWWIPLAIALAGIGAAWLAWAGGYYALATVTARVETFEIVSDSQINVRVSVDRPDPSRGAECLLYAKAVSYDRVGEQPVVIPPGGDQLSVVEVELRTFRRATTAVIDSCHTTG